jgi:hypothetical protein
LLRYNRVKKIVLVLVCFGTFDGLGLLVVDYVKYNAQIYEKDIEAYSRLDASITYIGSLFNSNKIKDA